MYVCNNFVCVSCMLYVNIVMCLGLYLSCMLYHEKFGPHKTKISMVSTICLNLMILVAIDS